MWPVLFVLAALLLVAESVLCLWFRAERSRLARNLADADAQVQSLRSVNTQLEKDLVAARTQLNGLDDRFRALAGQVLIETSKQSQAQADQKLQALLNPIKETFARFDTHVREVERAREGAYQALRQQVTSLSQQNDQLRGATDNLVKALRRPEVRGRWGELAIERVLTLAGLTDQCHDSQVTSADGTLRVDKVVHLPRGRCVVIDVKTPIDAYLSAIETEDQSQRQVHLDRHVRQIEDKVRELSSKRYQDHYPTADLIVMFIPGEAFLHAAAERKPNLIEQAMEQSVVIATPTTLVALLKAVAMGWREEKLADNARKISEVGRELHERIAVAVSHVESLGNNLGKAVKAYNDFVGSFDSRVVVSARKLKDLGSDSARELPAEGELKQVDITPRTVESKPA